MRTYPPIHPEINLDKMLKECIEVCKMVGLKLSKRIFPHIEYVKRKDFYAVTEKMPNGYKISFSYEAYKKYGPNKEAIKNLMLHELCHTISGCYDHRRKWKDSVIAINGYGYKISPYPYSIKKSKGLY